MQDQRPVSPTQWLHSIIHFADRKDVPKVTETNDPKKTGGAEGNRTPDLYNAIVALSQLSYGPEPVQSADLGHPPEFQERGP